MLSYKLEQRQSHCQVLRDLQIDHMNYFEISKSTFLSTNHEDDLNDMNYHDKICQALQTAIECTEVLTSRQMKEISHD